MAEAVRPRRQSWWAQFGADLRLRIEHRGAAVWYLIFERGLKGVALVLAGIYVLAHVRSGLDGVVGTIVEQFNLDAGSSFLRHWVYQLVLKFTGMSTGHLFALSVGFILYGLIEAAESVGLILRRRWAEYLVVVATAFFIPIEVVELVKHITVFKAAAFVLNVVVLVYLVQKKRLFRFDEPADER